MIKVRIIGQELYSCGKDDKHYSKNQKKKVAEEDIQKLCNKYIFDIGTFCFDLHFPTLNVHTIEYAKLFVRFISKNLFFKEIKVPPVIVEDNVLGNEKSKKFLNSDIGCDDDKIRKTIKSVLEYGTDFKELTLVKFENDFLYVKAKTIFYDYHHNDHIQTTIWKLNDDCTLEFYKIYFPKKINKNH